MIGDNNTRPIDEGGMVVDEAPYEGKALVVFAIDPGITTGLCALKVPVDLLPRLGVARTLVRCRLAYTQLGRSGARQASRAGGAYDSTDPRHVDAILAAGRQVYGEWCMYEKTTKKGKVKEVADPDTRFAFVMEGFDLRMQSKDPSLLAPVRVASILEDRLATARKEEEGLPPTFYQSASDAKNVVTDERLRRWGVYDKSSGVHARDAMRHAILFTRRFAADAELRRSLFGPDPFLFAGEGEA